MSLWSLCVSFLLVLNGFAILNERRFLARYGWGYDTMHNLPSTSFKGQVIGMLHACTYARVPLIFLNTVVIAVKLVFG
ncbi:hypothetical protein PPROV_000372600 [Pycnococcus provasolii]|uniref:Yos1-like protein n=1 Tax=Pycnococcus provasolii TaxID=41880 RepID=A0A830HD61_9CHLO|nr:hypothetical protein PPROV_000372600 [Pycnococcus provasolii]